MTTSLAQKKAFNNWRHNNPDKWRDYCRKGSSNFIKLKNKLNIFRDILIKYIINKNI